MRLITGFFFSAFLFFIFYSCQKEKFITDSSAKLSFSTDSIKFDTVFSTIGSASQALKVYNPHKDYIRISSIRLAGKSKQFRLNINGISANSASDVEIPPKDSLYIFVEVTANPTNKNEPLFINDSIVFETNGNLQDVKLIAYGQDVIIFKNAYLKTMTLTKDKPYLFLGGDTLLPNEKLTIEAGAKLFFHKYSSLCIAGEFEVNGTKEEPVVFKTDRLEEMYDDVPGLWNGLTLIGKANKTINYAEIRCANIGIYVNDSIEDASHYSLKIMNSRVEHHTYYGLLSVGASVQASNCLFSDCGIYSVNLCWGGFYDFYHCTIANYWGCYTCPIRKTSTLRISNYVVIYDSVKDKNIAYPNDLLHANFYNSIVYGNLSQGELELAEIENYQFNYFFDNCLLRIDKQQIPYNNPKYYNRNTYNPSEFSFKNPYSMEYNFNLDTLSVAQDAANSDIIFQHLDLLEFDQQGRSRLADKAPDIGAFERIDGILPKKKR